MNYFTFKKHGEYFKESILFSKTLNEHKILSRLEIKNIYGTGNITLLKNRHFHCENIENIYHKHSHVFDDEIILSDFIHGMNYITVKRKHNDFLEYILFSYHFSIEEIISLFEDCFIERHGKIILNHKNFEIESEWKDELDKSNILKLLKYNI